MNRQYSINLLEEFIQTINNLIPVESLRIIVNRPPLPNGWDKELLKLEDPVRQVINEAEPGLGDFIIDPKTGISGWYKALSAAEKAKNIYETGTRSILLSHRDKQYLEKLFQMSDGYVINFTNQSMQEFFKDTLDINIYDECYSHRGGSKANRIRGFWDIEDDLMVGNSIIKLVEYIETGIDLENLSPDDYKPELIAKCRQIGNKLLGDQNFTVDKDSSEVKAFMRQDFDDITTAIGTIEADVKEVIKQRITEMEAILTVAPLAAILLIGSTLEGILLDIKEKNSVIFTEGKAALIDKNISVSDKWSLNDLINVACETGFIKEDVKAFSHSLRQFRNYIHPKKQAKAKFYPDKDSANICFQVLKAAITQIYNKQNGILLE